MSDKNLTRMRDHAAQAFEKTLSALLGKSVSVAANQSATGLKLEPTGILRQQTFSILPDPAAWIYAGEPTWKGLSSEVLLAAGLDEILEEDQRSTWSEVTQQSFGAVASILTAEVRREVTVKAAVELLEPPDSVTNWLSLDILIEDQTYSLSLAFSDDLLAIYDPASFTEVLERPQKAARGGGVSKTFDLLLDVALPLSVSFGSTSLQLREVLKLNTGSIVELDRLISEPVDLIVNDCVIARGDVVVVDGNYGVRIRQLSSREDRLRSGVFDVAAVTSRKP